MEGMRKGGAGWQVHVLESAQRGLTPLGMGCSEEQDHGRVAQCCWMEQHLCDSAPQVCSHQRPFLLGSPEAVVMGCVVGQSQTQLSPSRPAQVGLATRLPGCPRSPWLPWGAGPFVPLLRRCGRAGRCAVSVPPRGRRPGTADLSSAATSRGCSPKTAGALTGTGK